MDLFNRVKGYHEAAGEPYHERQSDCESFTIRLENKRNYDRNRAELDANFASYCIEKTRKGVSVIVKFKHYYMFGTYHSWEISYSLITPELNASRTGVG